MFSLSGAVSASTAQGIKKYQEDRFLAEKIEVVPRKGGVIAVMDGHGGSEVADYCVAHLKGELIKALLQDADISEALRKTIAMLNNATRNSHSGSTISLAYIPDDVPEAYLAILGDSPIIARDADLKLFVSPEHNVRSNEAERAAALARGGIFEDGYIFSERGREGVQLSRALGNVGLDKILAREPDIFRIPLGPQSFILVASDGVFDPNHGDIASEIKEMVGRVERGWDADDIVDAAVKRRTGDNVTAVLWRATDLIPEI